MDTIAITTDSIKTIGIFSTIIAILLYLAVEMFKSLRKDKNTLSNAMMKEKEEQGILLSKEREELKARIFFLEKEWGSLNQFIRDQLINIITKNDNAYISMCASNKEICNAIEELKKSMSRRRSTDEKPG